MVQDLYGLVDLLQLPRNLRHAPVCHAHPAARPRTHAHPLARRTLLRNGRTERPVRYGAKLGQQFCAFRVVLDGVEVDANFLLAGGPHDHGTLGVLVLLDGVLSGPVGQHLDVDLHLALLQRRLDLLLETSQASRLQLEVLGRGQRVNLREQPQRPVDLLVAAFLLLPAGSVVLLVELVGVEVLGRDKEGAVGEEALDEGVLEGEDVVVVVLAVEVGDGEVVVDVLGVLALAHDVPHLHDLDVVLLPHRRLQLHQEVVGRVVLVGHVGLRTRQLDLLYVARLESL